MTFIKKHKIIFSILFLISFYFALCSCLYFFEPVSYHAPNLNRYDEYFKMYSYYNKTEDEKFYIKQINADDIKSADNDVRLKYVGNTAVAIAFDSVEDDEVTTLLNEYNAFICGHIEDVNFYQIEFNDNLSFTELDNVCKQLSESDIFSIVLPDYFEEMPTDSEDSSLTYESDSYYYDMINAYDAWDIYYQYNNIVNVGIIDVLVDHNNKMLNIGNSDNYLLNSLNSSLLYGGENHGTHVAGIINADYCDGVQGLASDSVLYSYNGVNVSTSYWIASICDMLLRKDVKVINISMGYNSYISISAQLGDKNALEYIQNENILFTEILSDVIDADKEFVICIAAGNNTNTPLYRAFFDYFGYGDKALLAKLDFFGIFDICPDFVDAKYSFFISDSAGEDVSDRIITVGSVGEDMSYSYFSNAGSVDIAAPGEYIYSTVLDNKFDYMSGTSMATPFVSGTAAMIFSINPNLTGAQVKDIILASAPDYVSAKGFDYPVLNAGAAVSVAHNNSN